MTETDLLLKMIDEKGINELLKFFGLSFKKGNLEFKKFQLRKVFKGGNINLKKNKLRINEFDAAISYLKNPLYKGKTIQELIAIFERDIKNDIPNYKRFANLYNCDKELIKENIQLLNNNYDNNISLYTGLVNYTTVDEVENKLKSSDMYDISVKRKAINFIISNLTEVNKLMIKELETIVKEWTLVDYYNKLIQLSEKYPSYLVQLEYLKLHENKLEIENSIAIEMLINFHIINEEKVFSNEDKNLKNEELKNELGNLKDYNEKLKSEFKLLNKKIEDLKKSQKVLIDENKNYKIESKISIIKEKEYLDEIDIKNKKISDIQKENLYIASMLQKEKTDNLKLSNKIKEYTEKFGMFEAYINQACSKENNGYEYEFAMICNGENLMCKILYPEILFINGDSWEEWVNNNKSKINKLNKIYIQRYSLSNDEVRKVNRYFRNKSIKVYTIYSKNEKEIIEEIIKIKVNMRA